MVDVFFVAGIEFALKHHSKCISRKSWLLKKQLDQNILT